MSETARALGLPGSFEWQGRTLKVSPITLEIEGIFAHVLKERTAQGLQEVQGSLGEQAYRDALEGLRDDLAAGEFEWTGRVARKAVRTHAGTRELAWLCLTLPEPPPRFTRKDLDALARSGKPWDQLLVLMNELNAPPPNGQGPSEEEGGQSSGLPT